VSSGTDLTFLSDSQLCLMPSCQTASSVKWRRPDLPVRQPAVPDALPVSQPVVSSGAGLMHFLLASQ